MNFYQFDLHIIKYKCVEIVLDDFKTTRFGLVREFDPVVFGHGAGSWQIP